MKWKLAFHHHQKNGTFCITLWGFKMGKDKLDAKWKNQTNNKEKAIMGEQRGCFCLLIGMKSCPFNHNNKYYIEKNSY